MLPSKLNQELSFSVNSKPIFTEASEQGSFSRGSWNEYNESYAAVKTEQ